MKLNALRGPDGRSGVPPLVLLHGFALHAGVWAQQMSGLGRRWPVVALDLRGFGGSTAVEDGPPPSMDVMAADVAETLHYLGIASAIVCGLSMGGYVSMALARRFPAMVGGLVLVDTKREADGEPRRRERERLAATVERDRSVRIVEEEVAPRFTGATTRRSRPAVQELVDGFVASTPVEGAAWALRAMAGRRCSTESLRAFTKPVLVVVGEEDVVSPREGARAMAGELRAGSFVCLPKAGHLSPVETATAFDEAVLAWLRQHFVDTERRGRPVSPGSAPT